MSDPNSDKNLRILVVDDNRSIHDDFRKILCSRVDNELDDVESELFDSPKTTAKRPPFQVDSAFQGQEGLALVQKANEQGRPYAVAFIDIRMPPGWDGVETTSRIWEICPDLQIVICTAYSDYSWNEMAAKLNSPDRLVILKKPFDAVEVLQLAHALTEKWRLVQEVKSKMDHLETLVEERTKVLKVEIAERRRAADAWRQSEERYHSLFQKNPLPTWLIDLDTMGFVAVNEAATQKYGYSSAEFQSMTVKDLHLPEDRPSVAERFGPDQRHKPTDGLITRHRKKDGSIIFAEIVSRLITIDGRELKLAVADDITERKLAEDRIRDQAELLDLASDAIVVRDVEGYIQFWNKGAERLYGWTVAEAMGAKMSKLFSQDDLRTLQAAEQEMSAKGEWSGELRKRTQTGQEIFVSSRWTLVRDDEGRPRSILMINTDVTEKKKLETQFLRAQRMEGIGTLATGMAHDLNNILAPILMSAGTLRWDMSAKDKELAISRIETSVKRGAAIIQQVLTFGRGINGDRTPVQPAEIVEEVCKIVGQTFPKDITIQAELAKGLWPVMGDRTQIHQVLLNLCVNARDAMPKGGRLGIVGRNIHLTQPKAALPGPAAPGAYVRLQISDTGCGIPPGDRERIFDPFFTTKEVGKGTGLGLSTVLGIVKSHRGVVTVSSEMGEGTTFEILLPASAEAAAIIAPAVPEQLPRGAGETVLIVDDEPDIISGMRTALQSQNYRVLVARNGREALDSVKANGQSVNVVVTDLMMPEMDGLTLIRGLRVSNPDLRIIASSGLSADAGGRGRNQELRSLGVKSFLSKPYTADKLLTALHDLLHPNGGAAQAA
jgi:two-component system cell cycle sensor histidine kinase/response regulator CckA